MNATEALAFVRTHGIVLMAARGAPPTLTHAIAGAPISGSWWAHPKAHHIFQVLEAVRDSRQVLVCRLIDDKVTLVHRRLWPALVRLARRLPRRRLAAVREEHTAGGRHRVVITPFPRWVPGSIRDRARSLGEAEALSALGPEVFGRAVGTTSPSSGPGRPGRRASVRMRDQGKRRGR